MGWEVPVVWVLWAHQHSFKQPLTHALKVNSVDSLVPQDGLWWNCTLGWWWCPIRKSRCLFRTLQRKCSSNKHYRQFPKCISDGILLGIKYQQSTHCVCSFVQGYIASLMVFTVLEYHQLRNKFSTQFPSPAFEPLTISYLSVPILSTLVVERVHNAISLTFWMEAVFYKAEFVVLLFDSE